MSNLRTCKVCGDLHMPRGLIEGRCHKCAHRCVKELKNGLELAVTTIRGFFVVQVIDKMPDDEIQVTWEGFCKEQTTMRAICSLLEKKKDDIPVPQEQTRTIRIIALIPSMDSPYRYLRKRILANGDEITECSWDGKLWGVVQN